MAVRRWNPIQDTRKHQHKTKTFPTFPIASTESIFVMAIAGTGDRGGKDAGREDVKQKSWRTNEITEPPIRLALVLRRITVVSDKGLPVNYSNTIWCRVSGRETGQELLQDSIWDVGQNWIELQRADLILCPSKRLAEPIKCYVFM